MSFQPTRIAPTKQLNVAGLQNHLIPLLGVICLFCEAEETLPDDRRDAVQALYDKGWRIMECEDCEKVGPACPNCVASHDCCDTREWPKEVYDE